MHVCVFKLTAYTCRSGYVALTSYKALMGVSKVPCVPVPSSQNVQNCRLSPPAYVLAFKNIEIYKVIRLRIQPM